MGWPKLTYALLAFAVVVYAFFFAMSAFFFYRYFEELEQHASMEEVTAEFGGLERASARPCAIVASCECARFPGPIMPCSAANLAFVQCFDDGRRACRPGQIRLCTNVVDQCFTPEVTYFTPAFEPRANQTRFTIRGDECPPDVGLERSNCESRQFTGVGFTTFPVCRHDGEDQPRLGCCDKVKTSLAGGIAFGVFGLIGVLSMFACPRLFRARDDGEPTGEAAAETRV